MKSPQTKWRIFKKVIPELQQLVLKIDQLQDPYLVKLESSERTKIIATVAMNIAEKD